MKRFLIPYRLLAAAVLSALIGTAATRQAEAARIHHKDGTTVEGKIVYETPEQIRIETSYGTLNYPKEDLTKIERDGPAGGVPTPRLNYTAVIPAGPVNPSTPPQVPPLVRFSSRSTTQTTTALPGGFPPAAIPTPVAPAVPAGPVAQDPQPAPAPVAPASPSR